MLVVEDEKHLTSVRDFADRTGQRDDLEKELSFLADFGDRKDSRCRLWKDGAPQSFYFVIEVQQNGEWKRWLNGGLIYHGAHDNGGDGGAPTFAVSLTPQRGWCVHT